MDTDRSSWWRQLNVVVIGGGLGQFAFGALASIVLIIDSPANQLVGGLATAISLRQAGHRIPIMNKQITQAIQAHQPAAVQTEANGWSAVTLLFDGSTG